MMWPKSVNSSRDLALFLVEHSANQKLKGETCPLCGALSSWQHIESEKEAVAEVRRWLEEAVAIYGGSSGAWLPIGRSPSKGRFLVCGGAGLPEGRVFIANKDPYRHTADPVDDAWFMESGRAIWPPPTHFMEIPDAC